MILFPGFLNSFRVYCIIGDGESAEGSVWEAMSFSSHYKLDNLVCIFDVNRLGQSEPAPLQHDLETYKKRAEAFGYVSFTIENFILAIQKLLAQLFFKVNGTRADNHQFLACWFYNKKSRYCLGPGVVGVGFGVGHISVITDDIYLELGTYSYA